jgi:hypothetical protein
VEFAQFTINVILSVKTSGFFITLIETKNVIFFNKSKEELIRSIFYNRSNDSVIVVSVTKRDDFNSLKCRTVPVRLIERALYLHSENNNE